MRVCLALLVLLPLAACERPSVAVVPEVADAPVTEAASKPDADEAEPHPAPAIHEAPRETTPPPRLPPVRVDGQPGTSASPPLHRDEMPTDGKHAAWVQSEKADSIAVPAPDPDEIAGTEPADPFGDEVMLPGSVVL